MIPALALTTVLPVSYGAGWPAAGRGLGARLAHNSGIFLASLLGALVLTLAGMLPIAGFAVGTVVSAWGIGAAAVTLFGSRPRDAVPPAVPSA